MQIRFPSKFGEIIYLANLAIRNERPTAVGGWKEFAETFGVVGGGAEVNGPLCCWMGSKGAP